MMKLGISKFKNGKVEDDKEVVKWKNKDMIKFVQNKLQYKLATVMKMIQLMSDVWIPSAWTILIRTTRQKEGKQVYISIRFVDQPRGFLWKQEKKVENWNRT